jgi:hypothetical protein
MGYELHMTRRENWFEESDAINISTEAEDDV